MSLKRCHCLNINIGGDTWEDVLRGLSEIVDELQDGPRNMITGGCTVGWSVEYTHDPTMTHDRYFEELKHRADGERISKVIQAAEEVGMVHEYIKE